MKTKKKTSAERRATRRKYNWTNQDLELEVAKLPDTVEIYWHYDDEMSNEDVAKIVNEGLENLDEVATELEHSNMEELWRLQDQQIEERLEDMRTRGEVTPKCERRFRTLVEESDKLLTDVNLKDLARNNRNCRLAVVLKEPEVSFQAWRGVESKGQVDELCAVCDILNVNPARLQKLVTADNDNRPSYDPEPVVFPEHPERDGHEYVKLDDLLGELSEASYGGNLTFMVTLDLRDLIKDPDAYRNGPIKVLEGTLGLFYEHCNGAGSTAEMPLVKDLLLPAGSYRLRYDAVDRNGLQSCYGFTREPWNQGNIEIVQEPPTPETHEPPTLPDAP